MSNFNNYAFTKTSFNSKNPWQSSARHNWINIAGVIWLVVSIYPVMKFFFFSSSSKPVHYIPNRSTVTVTRTVDAPALQTTALSGALSLQNLQENETAYRVTDVIDMFANFKQTPKCTLSSLELHGPFSPLCEDKESLMEAMSSGGRIGVDAPYSPRGCDMRWFSQEEICRILGRFEHVAIVGDSMMRNLAVALNIYLRADLVNGGFTNWVAGPEGVDCTCTGPFETSKCGFFSVVDSDMAWQMDPESMYCDYGVASIRSLLEYPINAFDLQDFLDTLDTKKPQKPYAFIMGHGLWNDLDKEQTYSWLEQVVLSIQNHLPWLQDTASFFPRIFLTPNAAGVKKPDIFITRQGNIALARFENAVGPWVRERGIDHLGTFNATIQTTNPDGTHGGMKNNLLKAMMIFNWLNSLDVHKYY